MARKRKRMSPEEWAEYEARADARISQLRAIEARLASEIAAEKEARERLPRRRRWLFGLL
jgi:hypothetical protein